MIGLECSGSDLNVQEAVKRTRMLVFESNQIDAERAVELLRREGVQFAVVEEPESQATLMQQRRLEGLGKLTGGIAFELNSLLAPVLTATRLLKDEARGDSARSLLDAIDANVRRAASVVKQVLTFAGGLEPKREVVDMTAFVADIAGLLGETFSPGIAVRVETAPGLWPVLADVSQLHQVLLNLSLNAREAMPEGGTLTLRAHNIQTDAAFTGSVPGAAPGHYVCLSVSDTGLGMPVEWIERIFDPSFKCKEQAERGTGIGLSTVNAIVRSHGGFVRADSVQGQGSCFSVYLPAAEIVCPCAVQANVKLEEGKGQLILVIEDEARLRSAVSNALEEFGYKVLTAANGMAGVEMFAERCGEIDMVVTDLVMPDLDGAETIQRIRAISPQTRIVLMTGDFSRLTNSEWRALSVQGTLSKPFTVETLLMVVQAVLKDAPLGWGVDSTRGNVTGLSSSMVSA
ncbi:MAG: response regulator [Verrucomicrobiota bacterium]|nr:response regulator [Verrucomicrobiota bacterium]